MAKEFDIYLNNRLTQCDIIIHNILFRDSLTAAHRMILESCIESLVLQKFTAVQTKSELVPKIDRLIKTCYEKLSMESDIDIKVDFHAKYLLDPMSVFTDISSSDNVDALIRFHNSIDNSIGIGIASVNAMIAKSLGIGTTVMTTDLAVRNVLKRSILHAINGTAIQSGLTDIKMQKKISVDALAFNTHAELANLCYRLYTTSGSVMNLAASILETEIHYPLGGVNMDLDIGLDIVGEYTTKYETLANTVSMLAEVTEAIIQFMEPSDNCLEFAAEIVGTVLKRHRMLKDMDDNTLAAYDNTTLEEVDYFIS